ncbi:hypothetical protein Tco_0506627 [Tanacetum coccineum]
MISLNRGSFDVIVGIDWLSKRKFVIICHEKVVEIPLEGSRKLRVQGERTLGAAKALMNAKVDEPKVGDISVVRDFVDVFPEDFSRFVIPTQRQVEFRIDLVHGATPVAKSPYRLAPSEMQELSKQLQELQDEDVKDKILASPSETVQGRERASRKEMLVCLGQKWKKRANDGCTLWIKLYSKYEYEIRYHPGRANVVIDALRRKERVKPRRGMMRTVVMDEAHASRFRWMIYLVVLADAAESVSDAIRFEYCLASSSGWTKSPVIWAEIGGSSLIGPELVQEMTNKVVLVKEKPKAAGDRQKSYANNRRNPLEFKVRDWVMLKVTPWKGDIRFGKKGKLAPRYVGPFEILDRIVPVAYRLRLPEELSGVHDTFHVSNLKKC